MVLFLPRRALERLTRMRVSGRQRLPLVERLRAHFADVVHAHEGRRVPAVLLAQFSFRQRFGGGVAARLRNVVDSTQRTVDLRDESVDVPHPLAVAPRKKRAPCGARSNDAEASA